MTTGQNLFKKIIINGVEANIAEIDSADGKFHVGEGVKNAIVKFVLKDNTVIPANLFNKNSQITDVILPNTIKTISENAFNGNINLSYIFIPETTTEIGNYAFDPQIRENLIQHSYSHIVESIIGINMHAFDENEEPISPTPVEEETSIEDGTPTEEETQIPNSNVLGTPKKTVYHKDLIEPEY